MKKSLSCLCLLVALIGAPFAEASVFCEADCGIVTRVDVGGAFSYVLIPQYRSCGQAFGSGETIDEAYEKMQNKCRAVGCHLHNGFDAYSGSYIKLKTSFKASSVCR